MNTKKDKLRQQLDKTLNAGFGPKAARMALSFVGGMIPVAGGVFSGISEIWDTKEREKFQKITAAWLKLQEEEINEIAKTLFDVTARLDMNDKTVNERIQSTEYLGIVKKCFRDWSAAESEDKRIYIRNLLCNAASTSLTSDDVIRLFIDWTDKYSETHFKVLKEVYKHEGRGISRNEIWMNLNRPASGELHREDSSEADLFKLIVHDLSVGRVIRQYRPVDQNGNFLKKPKDYGVSGSAAFTSAFDNTKPYVLTELGKQFVHYTMNEIIHNSKYTIS